MSFLFSRNIKSETNRIRFDKKRAGALALAFLFLFSLTAVGCHVNTPQDENSAFRRYTKMVFAQETASNTVNLHYTLKNTERYGIENAPVTFGNFLTDETAMHVSIENMKESLSAFSYEELSVQNQLTYDVMRAYFEILEADADYLLY